MTPAHPVNRLPHPDRRPALPGAAAAAATGAVLAFAAVRFFAWLERHDE
ncbi:hypothetical protein ACFYNW_29745 [Streptomyces virginiae]